MSLADIKRNARTRVHAAFAYQALYRGTADPAPGICLSVRWHSALAAEVGEEGSAGWSGIVNRADQVVFNRDELTEKRVRPQHGGRLVLTELTGVILTLDSKEPSDGPVAETWNVTRQVPNARS